MSLLAGLNQWLYDRMVDEAQIPVANICNVPHVVFSIAWPMYRVHVHRTGVLRMLSNLHDSSWNVLKVLPQWSNHTAYGGNVLSEYYK